MKEFTFSEVTRALLEEELGLREVQFSEELEGWIHAKHELSEFETQYLESLQELLDLNVDNWNEQELSLHFIGPLFSMIRFTVPYKFNLFSDRPLSAVIKDHKLYGQPDGFIASGYRNPKIPYFMFTEYKRSVDFSGDPVGQALASMLVGQCMNEDSKTIYGCYVIGKMWHFITLENNQYCISNGHNALQSDIFEIGQILKELKQKLIILTS